MGLFAMQHAADPLFMSNWLAGLDRVAARRGYTSARALLDTLPGLEGILNQIAASMAAKGVDAASSVNQLIEEGDFATAARRWRLGTCARTAKDYLSGAGAEEAVSSREAGGPGAASWLLPPTKRQHRFTDQAFVTEVRLRMRWHDHVGAS